MTLRGGGKRTMSKHTPGPWRTAYGPVCQVMAGNALVADCYTEDVAKRTAKANARLIASAPELLEALRGLLVFAEQHVDHDSIREAGGDDYQGHNEGEYWWADAVLSARKAIAKAEGRNDD
jgi:hypothetical protein